MKPEEIEPGKSYPLVLFLLGAGGEPKMTIYPGTGHNSWTAAYADSDLMAWLFSRKKPDAQHTSHTGE